MTQLKYSRILLKLSGEQLAGNSGKRIDEEVIKWVAGEVSKAREVGAEIVIMVGGGNIARGGEISGGGINPVTGHYMGMLATMINGLAVADIFNSVGVHAHALSCIFAEQAIDSFTQRRAINHLNKGRVVVAAGGIGRPYLTTDTAAVNLALELDCDLVCKLTKVEGVYDKDPMKYEDAKLFDSLSFKDALEGPDIKVMDKAAMGLAMEQNKKILVFNFNTEDNILRAVKGERVGTIIS